MLIDILQIFQSIKATSSKNEKEAIIKKYKENKGFVEVLSFLYNPYKLTGIKLKKMLKFTHFTSDDVIQFTDIFEAIDYILDNNSGKEENVKAIANFINQHTGEVHDFLQDVFTKDYKCGITASTINKALGKGFIPQFKLQLAESYEDFSDKVSGVFAITEKLDGCFTGDMKVLMFDGTKKPIKNIEVGDLVLSFNEDTKMVESNRVVNKFLNGRKPIDRWNKIEVKSELGGWKKRVIGTKNHKFFTPLGWNNLENIQVDDEVYIYDYIPSQTEIEVLLGTVLGDTNIIKDNKELNTARFRMARTKKHEEYNSLLVSLFSNKIKANSKEYKSGYNADMIETNISTYDNLPHFMMNNENINKCSYKMSDDILNNFTPLSLAIFYIDDGTKRACKNDGQEQSKNVQTRASINVNRYKYDDVLKFNNIMENKFGFKGTIMTDKKLSNGEISYRIDYNIENSTKLFDIIAPYVPKCMRYKIGSLWSEIKEIEWWKDTGSYGLSKAVVTKKSDELSVSEARYKKTLMAYDLEVENNHTYFIENFAVHNCRCIVRKEWDKVQFLTRKGHPIVGMQLLEPDFLQLEDYIYDGELLINRNDLPSKEMRKLTSALVRKEIDNKDLIFHMFDLLPIEDFDNGASKRTYEQRMKDKAQIFNKIKFERVVDVPILYKGEDKSIIIPMMKDMEANGKEGLMLNKVNAYYQCKRHSNILKVKEFKEADLRIIGYKEGQGKYIGVLGSFIVEYKGFEVECGSGYTDEQRSDFWTRRDEMVGQIITVQYHEETSNKNGNLSISFPVFVDVRTDKDEVSYK